jgi:hypothetical protein
VSEAKEKSADFAHFVILASDYHADFETLSPTSFG